jgi:hypothetical protein
VSKAIAKPSLCPIFLVVLPLQYAFVVDVLVIPLVANLLGSIAHHLLELHQQQKFSVPSFAFLHEIDSANSFAIKDPLDVGTLSRQIT